MNEYGGYLEYKCRRCGEITASIHAPDCALVAILLNLNKSMPLSWGAIPVHSSDYHFCKDGNMGVTDFIGAALDKPRKKEASTDERTT